MRKITINRKKIIVIVTLLILAGAAVIIFHHHNDGKIIPISKQELNQKIDSKESFYAYVGRPNCPDCQEFYPAFEQKVKELKIRIFYFNTKVKASKKKEMREYVQSLGVEEIPAILEVKNGKIVRVYDGQTDKDMKDFYNNF